MCHRDDQQPTVEVEEYRAGVPMADGEDTEEKVVGAGSYLVGYGRMHALELGLPPAGVDAVPAVLAKGGRWGVEITLDRPLTSKEVGIVEGKRRYKLVNVMLGVIGTMHVMRESVEGSLFWLIFGFVMVITAFIPDP